MSVIAASICTRNGVVIVSRQFTEVSRTRIETLLSTFPRLVPKGKQHTSVEHEGFRFVYHLEDDVYILLTTTKSSNILQDINTLQTISQLVTGICGKLDEREINKHAFEIIAAFDEVITIGGSTEPVTMSQIKTFLEMDSHEERIQDIISRNKELEASEERKRRAKQLELQRREASKRNMHLSTDSLVSSKSSFMNSSNYSGYEPVSHSSIQETNSSVRKMHGQDVSPSTRTKSKKGLLLSNSKDNSRYVEEPLMSMKTANSSIEEEFHDEKPRPEGPPLMSATFEEQNTEKMNRDGQVDSWNTKGSLTIQILDSSATKIYLEFAAHDKHSTQYNTHPNISKEKFDSDIIALKDSSHPFPMNKAVNVLRWRRLSKDNGSGIKLCVWPTVSEGKCECSLELDASEIEDTFEVEDFKILIPIGERQDVQISAEAGEATMKNQYIEWTVPLGMDDNKSSSMVFTTQDEDLESLFPVRAVYSLKKAVCDFSLKNVFLSEFDEAIPFEEKYKVTGEIIMQ